MKTKTLFIPLLMLFIFKSLAQNTHEVSFYYGLTDSAFLTNKGLDGGASYDNTNSYEFGLKYLRNISDKLAIETGVNYFKTTLTITPAYTGNPVSSETEPFELVSFPIYANYTFGKYFYANAGPVLDFQSGNGNYDSQSGIGFGLGLGAKFKVPHFLIHINPNYKSHALIPFNKQVYHQKLRQFGLQIGLGFNF